MRKLSFGLTLIIHISLIVGFLKFISWSNDLDISASERWMFVVFGTLMILATAGNFYRYIENRMPK